MADEEQRPSINPGYPFGQLIKALSRTGERAAERVKQWEQVVAGLLAGTLRVGSRTPVSETPPWVTLEVVHGGFATGNYGAGGALLPHELKMLDSQPRAPNAAERSELNLRFLSDFGRAELAEMLRDGKFRVYVPEEGALLVVEWLLRHGEADRAAKLLEAITPFFDRLRFYPVPHPRPFRVGNGTAVQTVGEAVKTLRSKRPQAAVQRMDESVRVWAPLYDRAVALFLETVEGDLPTLQRSESGELARAPNGQPIVTGGWPCRHYTQAWTTRARALLDDFGRERSQHQLCRKPEKPKENFTRLRGYLEKCVAEPRSLTGRDVGTIRKILASFVTRYADPRSPSHEAFRARQRRATSQPAHTKFAGVLADRLERYPADEGVPRVEAELGPLSREEAAAIGATPDAPIPPALTVKAQRCLEAPLETLVERRLVKSAEAVARVLPALTASVRALAIPDLELRRIYAAIYLAFRRRRSLLLLDLESQVKLRELPWIESVEPWVGSDNEARAAAKKSLIEVVTLTLRSFPQTILPNKLVQELRTLASSGGVHLPLVDELAADIFMGTFSETFLRAAQTAARLLRGSLYERYYGLPYDRVLRLDGGEGGLRTAGVSPGFASLCAELAGTAPGQPWPVARNGTIIEQAQILTTHNLAVLFAELGLAQSLDLEALARRTFEWICRRLQLRISDWRAQLQNVKNAAYAWRQLLFLLSLEDAGQVLGFIDWSVGHLQKQTQDFQARFEPVLSGLRAVLEGESFGPNGEHTRADGRRFLGWTIGRHWLLPQKSL